MSPVTRKRKSPEPSGSNAPEHDHYAAQTPDGSPSSKRPKITQRQKQALIDNLQLEITERARKLRAHYALQAQDLRGRIERRVNRIPMALRKANMGELLAKHSESNKADAAAKKPATNSKSSKAPAASSTTGNSTRNNAASTTSRTRGAKRTSDEILASDKENAPFQDPVDVPLSNPKKRGANNAPASHPRVLSQFAETNVLSPKSSNSRTFPQSPLRNITGKSQQQQQQRGNGGCPSSPLKHASPIKSTGGGLAGMVENAKTRATRGAATAARKASPSSDVTGARRRTTAKSTTSTTSKGAPPSRPTTRQKNTRRNSGDSTISNISSGTTIVKTARGTTGQTPANKRPPVPRGQAATATSAAKKTTTVAARKAQSADQTATGKRVLRKRV
ncbi:hypothetical protein AJ79_03910 [Helicocarpus griseus UAMH5409]|uniref:Borealin N-terminal domain-containing protein n=1 Tax=Helicocarpus griseus UAMH5409 TaxID=1447875 RepID=A0A2B7XWA9_9EURO|nr:hypothetical protein AJ79_03910 [Helicocarpus griseus UAMH5409]